MAQAFAQDVVNVFNLKYKPRTYLHYSFTTSMQSSAPILRLTLDENWFGITSHLKMHRRSGVIQ
jgi:hypothetical protein